MCRKMNGPDINLISKISQIEKGKYYMFSLIWRT
jgi:hypothetical protein